MDLIGKFIVIEVGDHAAKMILSLARSIEADDKVTWLVVSKSRPGNPR